MANVRDDFLAPVRQRLMLSAGARCSNPNCRQPTAGPSDSSATRTANVGVAAHITAAAENGPRWDAALTPDERKAYDNGIWACASHGTLIDTDTRRYSVDLLRAWRERAEESARREIEGADPIRGLFNYDRDVGQGDYRDAIDLFADEVGLAAYFSEAKATLITRLLKELAYNAFKHAGTGRVYLSATSCSISLSHDGPLFTWDQLRTAVPDGGGGRSLTHLEAATPGELAFMHRFVTGRNEWIIVDLLGRARAAGILPPCSATSDELVEVPEQDLRIRFDDCTDVHVLLSEGKVMASDLRQLALRESQALQSRSVVFHGLKLSDPLCSYIRELFPEAKIV
jgi:hypothetical protein